MIDTDTVNDDDDIDTVVDTDNETAVDDNNYNNDNDILATNNDTNLVLITSHIDDKIINIKIRNNEYILTISYDELCNEDYLYNKTYLRQTYFFNKLVALNSINRDDQDMYAITYTLRLSHNARQHTFSNVNTEFHNKVSAHNYYDLLMKYCT